MSPFSSEDLDRIKAAVAEAEGKTSGEIVPYYVEASDDYDEAVWRGGIFFGVLALFAFFLIRTFSGYWLPFGVNEILLGILLAAGIGMALAMWVRPVRRWFAGRALLDRRTAARALEAFVEEEVFQTRDRTGILLFMSVFEHRVHVIGDSGINARVQQSDWDGVVELIVGGMKSGRPAEGLVRAIQKCGDLLQLKEVERRGDDTNELSDGLRIGE